MCGRYALYTLPEEVARRFGLALVPAFRARYNISPGQDIPLIRLAAGPTGPPVRVVECVRWGFVPNWSPVPGVGPAPINARSETAAQRPAFRHAFRTGRAIVPADGFFEWTAPKGGGAKKPVFIRANDGRPLGLAAIVETWTPGSTGEQPARPLKTCAILTTPPNALLGNIHSRMPAILDPADEAEWLDPANQDTDALRAMLRPAPDGSLVASPVTRRVNNIANDDARCIEPADADPPARGLFD